MAFRMMEIAVPAARRQELHELIEESAALSVWTEELTDDRVLARVLLRAEQTEGLSDTVSERFAGAEGFRIVLVSVEATVPEPEEPEEKEGKGEGGPGGAAPAASEAEEDKGRISREELYEDVSDGARISRVYLTTVVLSTVVASVGLLRDDVAVIIGAMVIAPLLRPNVALALAVTLGDLRLMGRSIRANAAGLAVALAVSVGLGLAFHVDPAAAQIASRTRVGVGDLGLALAAGSAGALAFTAGVPAALIGVMVAVALLPPAAVVGLLLGGGHLQQALGAGLLLLVNLACVNLAGVVTFLVQGVGPRSWREAAVAKKATRVAIALWLGLLAGLAVLILIGSRG